MQINKSTIHKLMQNVLVAVYKENIVFVNLNILGKLERGIHGEALPFEDEPYILNCTNTGT